MWKFWHMQLIPTNATKGTCFVRTKRNILNWLGFSPAWVSALLSTVPHLINWGKNATDRVRGHAWTFCTPALPLQLYGPKYMIYCLSSCCQRNNLSLEKARWGSAQYIVFLFQLHSFSIYNIELSMYIGQLRAECLRDMIKRSLMSF